MVPDTPTISCNSTQTQHTIQMKRRLECIPILHVRGTHYNIGRAIGQTFKSMIQEMLDSWPYFNDHIMKCFLQEDGKRIYENSLKLCKAKFPDLVDEIRGMADGCNLPFEKLFLLNIDSMITDKDESVVPMRGATGCTSIICNKEEVLLGHTEDAMCEILNNCYIISAEIMDSSGRLIEKFTTFSYAAHLMGYTMGFNEHGMVYSVNTLFPSIHKNGTPRAFIARAILGAKSFDSLLDILKDCGHGISDGMSLNVHFAKDEEPRRMFYNIEVMPPSPSSSEEIPESLLSILTVNSGESSVHCNKYLRFNAKEQSLPVAVSTNRQLTLERHPEPSGLSDIKFMLSDQSDKNFPVYICDEMHTKLSHIKTVAVGVFDMMGKTWSIYLGKPTESEPVAVLPLNF
ncbi:uncharacterized protein LOC110854655 [Folsomia candida]|uniref:uncharacterized protein LOC110854655 n=1 Tax=Folsomia candida TaxID=158441 RepID=UPI000B8F5450|nr:uncharacterized protein LOC110854655 [Folsomia candida]